MPRTGTWSAAARVGRPSIKSVTWSLRCARLSIRCRSTCASPCSSWNWGISSPPLSVSDPVTTHLPQQRGRASPDRTLGSPRCGQERHPNTSLPGAPRCSPRWPLAPRPRRRGHWSPPRRRPPTHRPRPRTLAPPPPRRPPPAEARRPLSDATPSPGGRVQAEAAALFAVADPGAPAVAPGAPGSLLGDAAPSSAANVAARGIPVSAADAVGLTVLAVRSVSAAWLANTSLTGSPEPTPEGLPSSSGSTASQVSWRELRLNP